MNSIYEQLLYTTLRIECFNQNGVLETIGTGFLLQRSVGHDANKIYLISNKHVLDGYDTIRLCFTTMKNNMPETGKKITIPITDLLGKVVVHPNQHVDIAVLECTGLFILFPDQLYFKAVSYDMLATFTEPELSVAQNVYFIGYPENRFDKANNLPLIRMGMIASHPRLDYNGDPVFVIDAQVFPGSSGSPVYIDLTYESMKSGKIVLGQRDIKLLGVVSATMIRNNQLKALQTSTILATQEVLGLGIVYKSTVIREIIDSMPTDN